MRKSLPVLAMAGIYILVQVAAVLLAPLFFPGSSAFPNPEDPVNPLIYVFMVLVMTGIILILIKYGRQRIIQAIFYISIFITLWFVFLPILLYIDSAAIDPDGWLALILSLVLAAGLLIAMIKKGEWYLIDGVGIIIAIGVTAILGMSFGILPAFILLIIMAIYDAISVYKTKHMIALAEGVTPLRLPVLFVIPKHKGFTMDRLDETGVVPKDGAEREALFMGVGDAVIPGLLVVSSSVFLVADPAFLFTTNIWVAIGTIVGGLLGFLLLIRFVLKGNPQAGLPFLNTGAILGYLITYAIVFQYIGWGMIGL